MQKLDCHRTELRLLLVSKRLLGKRQQIYHLLSDSVQVNDLFFWVFVCSACSPSFIPPWYREVEYFGENSKVLWWLQEKWRGREWDRKSVSGEEIMLKNVQTRTFSLLQIQLLKHICISGVLTGREIDWGRWWQSQKARGRGRERDKGQYGFKSDSNKLFCPFQ